MFEQGHDGSRRRVRVVGGPRTFPDEVQVAVNRQRPASLRQHLTSNDLCRVAVAVELQRAVIVAALHTTPIHGWVAQEDTHLALARQRCVHLADTSKEPLVDWYVPQGVGLRRVLPNMSKLRVRNIFTLNKPI